MVGWAGLQPSHHHRHPKDACSEERLARNHLSTFSDLPAGICLLDKRARNPELPVQTQGANESQPRNGWRQTAKPLQSSTGERA